MTVLDVPLPDLVDVTGYDEMRRRQAAGNGAGRPPRPPLVAVAAGWPHDGAAPIGNFFADTYNEKRGITNRKMRGFTNHAILQSVSSEVPRIASGEVADNSSSITTEPGTVSRLRVRLNAQAQRMAFKVTSLAALIAGPAHPWALEAWRAELAYRPSESDLERIRLGPWSQLVHALSLLFWGAPRLRAYYPRRAAGRQFDKILTSDIKTALVGFICIAALLIPIDRIRGLRTASAAAIALLSVTGVGIQWLRKRRLGPRQRR